MEHLLVSIPPDQVDFITQLLNKLSVKVTKVDSSDEENLSPAQYASALSSKFVSVFFGILFSSAKQNFQWFDIST